MELIKLEHIINFLSYRGWTSIPEQNGQRFRGYIPPMELGLPSDFILELPKKDNSKRFQSYAEDVIETLIDIYKSLSDNDLRIVFSNKNAIFSTKIEDEDTKDGSIKLERFGKKIEALIKIIKQSVTFASTEKPIFADAKENVKLFMDNCKGLQTEMGSFVTKIQLPNQNFQGNLNEKTVMDKLFQVLDFIHKEVLFFPIKEITTSHIENHKNYINLELFTAINDFHQKVQMNHGSFAYLSQTSQKTVIIQHFLRKKMPHFARYIKAIKNILVHETPLEAQGYIHSISNNVIQVETEIANTIEKVKLYLRPEDYREALKAHQEEKIVTFKGIAKVNKNQYFIKDVQSFETLDNNLQKTILTIPNA